LTAWATMRGAARWTTPLAATALLALLLALVTTGKWPELQSRVSFSPKGLVAASPADIVRVEIRSASGNVGLRRRSDGWSFDGTEQALPTDLASHVDTALRLIHVSEPAREIAARELAIERFAEFGLDPADIAAVLETRTGIAATVNFGALNPAGTSHYVRLGGAPTVYLMSRHVGEEWRLVLDMARRLQPRSGPEVASRGADLLLPVSMAQVWAVEIVAAGKLTRFERDAAGNWFKHVGQHTHAAGSNAHVADPEQARVIETAFRAFDVAAVETRVGAAGPTGLAQYGLALPTLIVLFYARDSSTPLARLEFGALADGLDRYARLSPDGAVVTAAEFEVRRLTELLKAVGAGS